MKDEESKQPLRVGINKSSIDISGDPSSYDLSGDKSGDKSADKGRGVKIQQDSTGDQLLK